MQRLRRFAVDIFCFTLPLYHFTTVSLLLISLYHFTTFCFTTLCHAGSTNNSGAAFLKIDPGARSAAMGGAYAALAGDVYAMHYNPAGLSRLYRREVAATHTQWLLGTQYNFAGLAYPSGLGAWGFAATRLAAGAIEGRDANRQKTAGFTSADTAYALGYGRILEGPFSSGVSRLGVSAKFIESRIGNYSAHSVAFDMGLAHDFGGGPVSLGVSVLNAGRGMRFLSQKDPLPLTLVLGSALKLAGAMQFAADLRYEPYDRRWDLGLGTEYAAFPAVSLRLGYASNLRQGGFGLQGAGPLSGLGAGLGLQMSRFQADYAFTPFGPLGNVQRVSLGLRF
ncbi:MAG: PorV/PorQ family protein [Elusimicrobia bacterium]|nr:PorV/PorQ family protein [Elusimicrobiota bacterium]